MSHRPRPALPEGPFLVVGLARSGVAAALALRARGERVIGVDGAGGVDAARELRGAGVEVRLREDGVDLLGGIATVVKSPGVPTSAPVIEAARKRGLMVLGELELGWRMLSNAFVGVTGTNGKTTTVNLIGHIYRVTGREVAMAGNVGVAITSLAGHVSKGATIVCEASSFQLQDTDLFAPDGAVLLNLSEDHLDRHATMAAYRQAKGRIFVNQRSDDVAVTPWGCRLVEVVGGAARAVRFGGPAAGTVRGGHGHASAPAAIDCSQDGSRRAGSAGSGAQAGGEPRVWRSEDELWWEGERLMAVEVALRGDHNIDNAMAAAAICLARGIDVQGIREGLGTFPGVTHRLEEIGERDGVLYVNDSKATNVASTTVALGAFASDGPGIVHLILGGRGKGQDFHALAGPVEATCRAVYLVGEDADQIASDLGRSDGGTLAVAIHMCGDLERAVHLARASARAGEVVLLSPACASFDQFPDFEARGEHFRELAVGNGA